MELDKNLTAMWLRSVQRLTEAESRAIHGKLDGEATVSDALLLRIQRLRVLTEAYLQRMMGGGALVTLPCPVPGCAGPLTDACSGSCCGCCTPNRAKAERLQEPATATATVTVTTGPW